MSSKQSFIRLFLFSSSFLLLQISSARSQTLFQNSNFTCETEAVTVDAASISCRNRSRTGGFTIADFNADGFADCATGEAVFDDTESTLQVSVLFNRAGLGTPCGDQFSLFGNYSLSGRSDGDAVTNISTGVLDSGLTDFALANNNEESDFDMMSVLNPGPPGFFGASGSELTTIDDPWQPAQTSQVAEASGGERSMALFDCNGDDFLDAALVVEQTAPTGFFHLNVLTNNGMGVDPLFALPTSVNTNVAREDNFDFARLTTGDFEDDGDLDVAVAIYTQTDGGTAIDQVITLCTNDGTCNFTCPVTPTIDLSLAHPGQNIIPNSVESGFFDEGTTLDLVVIEAGLDGSVGNVPGIHYYLGNGDNTFTANFHEDFDPPTSGALEALTTGCFNNDNIEDVAVAMTSSEIVAAAVGVFTSDGLGGVNLTTLTPALTPRFLGGIDASDFDNLGGDDIVVLGSTPSGDRNAFFFINTDELLAASAGADTSLETDTSLLISDASCTVSPEIPGDPARFAILWTVSPATGVTLTNPDQINPTFEATTPGSYTLTLSCRTRCRDIDLDDKVIQVAGPNPSPSASPEASPPVPPLPPAFATQGGCINSLNAPESFHFPAVWLGWVLLPALIASLRRPK